MSCDQDRIQKSIVARRPRLIGEGLYHHVYAWGNDRHPVFKADAHFEKYLKYLELYGSLCEIHIIAYGLMDWHIHLFLLDWHARLSEFMDRLHGDYAQFFNRVTGRVGHVFGERFKNKIVQSDSYGVWLSRYIHRQAVEAGLVSDPKDYKWTSYGDYLRLVPKGFVKPGVILDQFGRGKVGRRRYKQFAQSENDGPVNWTETRESVIGDDEFVEFVEVSKCRAKERNLDVKNLIVAVSRQLGVTSELVLNPRGRVQRKLRHEAFRILVDDYHFSISQVARAFGVFPNAVASALKKH